MADASFGRFAPLSLPLAGAPWGTALTLRVVFGLLYVVCGLLLLRRPDWLQRPDLALWFARGPLLLAALAVWAVVASILGLTVLDMIPVSQLRLGLQTMLVIACVVTGVVLVMDLALYRAQSVAYEVAAPELFRRQREFTLSGAPGAHAAQYGDSSAESGASANTGSGGSESSVGGEDVRVTVTPTTRNLGDWAPTPRASSSESGSSASSPSSEPPSQGSESSTPPLPDDDDDDDRRVTVRTDAEARALARQLGLPAMPAAALNDALAALGVVDSEEPDSPPPLEEEEEEATAATTTTAAAAAAAATTTTTAAAAAAAAAAVPPLVLSAAAAPPPAPRTPSSSHEFHAMWLSAADRGGAFALLLPPAVTPDRLAGHLRRRGFAFVPPDPGALVHPHAPWELWTRTEQAAGVLLAVLSASADPATGMPTLVVEFASWPEHAAASLLPLMGLAGVMEEGRP